MILATISSVTVEKVVKVGGKEIRTMYGGVKDAGNVKWIFLLLSEICYHTL